MENFSFLKDIENESKRVRFQVYEIKSGINTIKFKVPLKNTKKFEVMFEDISDINTLSIKHLLKDVDGVML